MIVIDARGLDPPEPFERLIEVLAQLAPGERVRMILDREPFPLYRFLASNHYAYQSEWIEAPDSRWEVLIWEPA